MAKDNSRALVETLNEIIHKLSLLDDSERRRIMNSVATFFEHGSYSNALQDKINTVETSAGNFQGLTNIRPSFSDDRAPTPKEFLFEKQPKTDVERVACLAFYLTHFRDTPHFKTLDLGKLNTEAAQIKFSNTAYATENATKAGFLAPAVKGQKQITAWGEQFVAALPDRESASQVLAQLRSRKKKRLKP